jgi:hypothetical protein
MTLFSGMITVLVFELFEFKSGSCLISFAWDFNRSHSNFAIQSANERSNLVSLLRDFSNSYSRSDKRLLHSSNCSSWRTNWLFKSEC